MRNDVIGLRSISVTSPTPKRGKLLSIKGKGFIKQLYVQGILNDSLQADVIIDGVILKASDFCFDVQPNVRLFSIENIVFKEKFEVEITHTNEYYNINIKALYYLDE